MKIKWLIFALMILGATAGCKKNQENQIAVTVIESEEVIVSEITPQQLIPLDTVQIIDGAFGYALEREEPTFLLFEFSSGARIPILVDRNDVLTLTVNDTVPYGSFTATG